MSVRCELPVTVRGAICALVLAAGMCHAQEKTAPPDDARSVIVADTEEVSLDLVIRDKKGHPVKDLQPADLKILDAGSPVAISDLRIVSADADAEHLVTLLYDRLDSSAGQNARDITAKLLKLQPGIRVSYAVFGIKGRMRLLQPYTTDVDAIQLAARVVTGGEKKGDPTDLDVKSEKAITQHARENIASSTPGKGTTVVSTDERVLARTTLAALEDAQRIMQDQHAKPALAGLLGLIRAQRDVRGRKVIVYFARGWPSDENARDMLRSIVGAANRAGVSIYTVDANGLDPAIAQGMITSMVMSGQGVAARANAASPRNYGQQQSGPALMITPGQKVQMSEQFDRFGTATSDTNPLQMLAKQTGGQYIALTDNSKKPLQRMFEDMAVYYQASYVPPPHESDGQFRPVSVTTLRRGLVIQARSGYFALPPATGSGVRPFEAPLLKLLEQANLPTDLHFHADVLRMGEVADEDQNSLVVEVPMSQVELAADPTANLFSGHVSIVAQIKDKNGAVIQHFSEDVPRHGALEAIEKARGDVITMQRHFSAAPGNYTLEAVVMDRNTGNAGGYRQKVQIAAGASGPAISDLVLVRRETPYSAETDPGEPLRYEKSKIVPSLSDQLPDNAKTISLFFVLHPDPKGARPMVELEVRRDGEAVMRGPLQLHAGAGGAVPYLASLQSASLEPGDYEIAALFTQGGEAARRSVTFSIPGTGTPPGDGKLAAASHEAASGEISSAGQPRKEHMRSPLQLVAAGVDSAPLSSQDAADLIAEARTRALGYTHSLPNFMCVEVTDRSIDSAGNGAWHHRDSMAELLRYNGKEEHRVTLEVNGRRSDVAREDMHGTITHGEFGGIANTVFRPEAKADFHWKQTAMLGNGTVQVFAFRVSRANSDFSVVDDSGRRAVVGFHGFVYIDDATRAVRRITLEADEMPGNFVIRSTSFSIDYDYVSISSHEYLMPVSGTVTVQKGKRTTLLNEMEFRDYRKYGSQTSIRFQ